jgi:hypothetical protein
MARYAEIVINFLLDILVYAALNMYYYHARKTMFIYAPQNPNGTNQIIHYCITSSETY